MGQILVRNVSEKAIESFKFRARLKGTSLEQEVRQLIEANAPFTPEERASTAQAIREKTKGIAPSLTLDEIRDGLE
jgi:plasmid stability protein